MKRLLAAGLPRIFQIAAVFRDGDHSPTHRPEFRLLEWYRRDAPWDALLPDCEALVRAAARAAGRPMRFSYRGRDVDLSGPFERVTMEQAFVREAGFSILESHDRARLARQLDHLGLRYTDDDTWSDLFHRVYLTKVEPALARRAVPVFLTHYPAPLAALARNSPDDPRVSERFELFAGGLELANGFGELTDSVEQRERFVADRAWRRSHGMNDYPLDERFLEALPSLPPSAGIALGLERLLMLVLDAAEIDAVAFLPWAET
jgi:elongation factor P--(R)-beta-lysine ligase